MNVTYQIVCTKSFFTSRKWKISNVFSVCILPEYRGHGYAREMVKEYVEKRKNDVDGFILNM